MLPVLPADPHTRGWSAPRTAAVMIFIHIPASSPLALVFIVPRLSAVSHTEFDLSVRREPNCGCGVDGGVPARHILVSACARDVARPMPLAERAL